jgi:hypothetical protein
MTLPSITALLAASYFATPDALPPDTAPLAPSAALSAAYSQIVNPADKQKPPEQAPGEVDPSQVSTSTVTARRVSQYREEDRFGPYDQPLWTSHRRFPTTRIYVRPPGTFEFEYWKRVDIPHGGGPAEVKTQYEFEVGLPGRFQVDMYMVSNAEGNDGPSTFDEEKLEVRWAFADWDVIWGNPTLYVELASANEEPDTIESKLLLGGEMTPGWHWGSNLVFERETSGDLTNVYEITAGVSRVLNDESVSLGGELKASVANTHDDRSEYAEELLVGPSLQYRPLRNIHIDLATLVGIGSDSPDFEGFLVLGYEF